MTTARTTLILALLSLATTGCGAEEQRTGIKIQLQGDAEAIRAEIDRIVVAGVFCLVAGIVLLFAADHQEWVCVSTQLTQFHYYGHLFAAAGVTLLSRTLTHQKYELFN